MTHYLTTLVALATISARLSSFALEPIPNKLVVLTFDDSVKSHYTVARPLLKRYGFSATFFITEGFSFKTNKTDYMSWDEIAELHHDGFEIGNHTGDHLGISNRTIHQLEGQLHKIDSACEQYGIPKPTSFAWPGNAVTDEALPLLEKHGIIFSRRGGFPEFPRGGPNGPVYDPKQDHPLLIPSVAIPRPGFEMKDFIKAVSQANNGRISVLQFHGVPEGEHPWVHVSRSRFEQFMKYLHDHQYSVIALRDLAHYVDPTKMPIDPWSVIKKRQEQLGSISPTNRPIRWTQLPEPDYANLQYGAHERNVLDLWVAGTTKATPMVFFFHGGGFRSGDKTKLNPALLQLCLDRGVSVAGANYRLTQTASFPAQMHDSARAIQFLRHHANRYNLDPERVGCTGGSAGGGISLWLAFHSDLANLNSHDPIARQSTRITCAAVSGAQSSYDPKFFSELFSVDGYAHPALLPFYGAKDRKALDTPAIRALIEEASPINHATADDVPVFLYYGQPNEPLPANAAGKDWAHHPKLGYALKKKLDSFGLPCILRLSTDYEKNPNPDLTTEMARFFLIQFGMINR